MSTTFKALLITEVNGSFIKEIKDISLDKLPDNEVVIQVHYSSVNYKDALSASGNKGVSRRYPHVPGIDAAGVVKNSKSTVFKPGDQVLVTGYDLGMDTWGGYAQYISVPADWIIALPKNLTLKEAMIYGTAGFTAGLSVYQIINAGIKPQKGDIAVSGATGGVGSIAVAILNKLQYNVAAISGKQEDDYLTQTLGASQIINRLDFVNNQNSKALAKPVYAAGVDTVGGEILSGMVKSTHYGGMVTCCGMVASPDLHTSIFPFILRGICLTGIDSVQTPMPLRTQIWQLLASGWKPANLNALAQQISLNDLPAKLDEILQGKAKGRYVLKHDL